MILDRNDHNSMHGLKLKDFQVNILVSGNLYSGVAKLSRFMHDWYMPRFHEQSLFAKYLHAFVSDFPNKCHLKCFNSISILRNRYNPMKNRYNIL